MIDWIEQHQVTIDLLKWTALLVLAWTAGIFRFFSGLTRTPKIRVVSTASRCLIQHMEEFEGRKKVMRATFLLNVEVVNPSSEKVVVQRFMLSYWRSLPFFPRSKELHSITLPARPRQEMGSGTKVSKVFFSNFPDGFSDLTMSGELEPKQFQSGYVMWVSFTWGSWNPHIREEHVRIRISAQLTSGKTLRSVVRVPVTRDEAFFEKWVPGILAQIGHQCAWNAFAE